MATILAGDEVRFTEKARAVPYKRWYSSDKANFIAPDDQTHVVASTRNRAALLENGSSWDFIYLEQVKDGSFDVVQAYLVGGAVRDLQLGLKPKDYDFTVEAPNFKYMLAWLRGLGAEIFLEKEEYGTIRALVPKTFVERFVDIAPTTRKHVVSVAADFVLARKDGYYSDGRRPDTVVAGTLADDLHRRDFTINAMALDRDRNLIDLCQGARDLREGQLRAVGNPVERLTEDALRAVRALRFAITKNLNIETCLADSMHHVRVLDAISSGTISRERVREELIRCFKYDTILTLRYLDRFSLLRDAMLSSGDLWLVPTLEKK